MSISFEAIYEGGVLKPITPLPFKEREQLRVVVESGKSLARETAGLLSWTGDSKSLQQIAETPEFGKSVSP